MDICEFLLLSGSDNCVNLKYLQFFLRCENLRLLLRLVSELFEKISESCTNILLLPVKSSASFQIMKNALLSTKRIGRKYHAIKIYYCIQYLVIYLTL